MTNHEFNRRWIGNILKNMNDQLDNETKIRLLETCGRSCARSGVIQSAAACAGDLNKFLSTMRKWLGTKNITQDGDTIHVIYKKCFCQLRALVPDELSEVYCNCSRGWLREMFETVVGKAVEVEIESTILRGSDKCQFTLKL